MTVSHDDGHCEISHPLPYPSQSAAGVEIVRRRLMEILSLLHCGHLTDAQMREAEAALALQVGNCETVHQFPLKNSHEPAFALALSRVDARV